MILENYFSDVHMIVPILSIFYDFATSPYLSFMIQTEISNLIPPLPAYLFDPPRITIRRVPIVYLPVCTPQK